ncbi:hypothetical protein IV203_030751 [Nitzschia inconspicua]|uniref:Uncharacterized protein n=1 Tax=Nitzschia inconspicua TaxID=303405 RepID=A0A9K3Q1Y1_9STRA|nr:hypothetical protein IV203_030751 [Nitzschia inconspicua]
MCNNTDSLSNNEKNPKLSQVEKQQEDHKLTVGETAQLFGNSIIHKATEAKDSFVDTLNGAKEGAIQTEKEIEDAATEKKNEMKDATMKKFEDARSCTAEKIGEIKDRVEPPPQDPETKTLGERLEEAKSAVAKAITSNLHSHPDEQIVLDDTEKNSENESSKPRGARIQDRAHGARKALDQLGEDTKQKAEDQVDSARSWTADQLGNLKDTIEPPTEEEEPKTLGDHLQNVGSVVADKVAEIKQGIIGDIQAGNDPHEDPKLRDDDNKPL